MKNLIEQLEEKNKIKSVNFWGKKNNAINGFRLGIYEAIQLVKAQTKALLDDVEKIRQDCIDDECNCDGSETCDDVKKLIKKHLTDV